MRYVLDPELRMLIRSLFEGEFADVGMINIGHDQPDSTFLTPQAAIVMDPLGVKFEPESRTEWLNHRNPPPNPFPSNSRS